MIITLLSLVGYQPTPVDTQLSHLWPRTESITERKAQSLREDFEAALSGPELLEDSDHEISDEMKARALALYDSLPSVLHEPEMSLTPAGSLMLEWYRDGERLAVYMTRAGSIGFAIMTSRWRDHGEFPANMHSLPEQLCKALREWDGCNSDGRRVVYRAAPRSIHRNDSKGFFAPRLNAQYCG